MTQCAGSSLDHLVRDDRALHLACTFPDPLDPQFAQEALGDIVFFEVQELGKTVSAGDTVAVIESVKAASDIYAPVSGEIIEANTAVADTPDSVNSAPYDSWLFKIKPAAGATQERLIDADAYSKSIGE